MAMNDSSSSDVTRLLGEIRDGDRSALERLLPIVYEELRSLAAHISRNPNHTLQPTAIVHEAYLRLAQNDGGWADRRHFFKLAAMAMRRLLIDHARRQKAAKRSGKRERLSFAEGMSAGGIAKEASEFDLVDFEEALEALEARDARQARVVELRFIVGLSVEETAEVLGISTRSVNVDWNLARAWLRRALALHMGDCRMFDRDCRGNGPRFRERSR